ncbi:MAG: hypothetical protein ACR2F6_03450, partial [Mycobacteriales bacterium]
LRSGRVEGAPDRRHTLGRSGGEAVGAGVPKLGRRRGRCGVGGERECSSDRDAADAELGQIGQRW